MLWVSSSKKSVLELILLPVDFVMNLFRGHYTYLAIKYRVPHLSSRLEGQGEPSGVAQ